MAITPSVVEPERRSRAQNVALGPEHLWHPDAMLISFLAQSYFDINLAAILDFFNYSMQLRFDFRFVIYAPKLVELDSFKRDLFIFEPYLLLAKISLKFCKYVRSFDGFLFVFVCLSVCLSVMLTIQVAPLSNQHQTRHKYVSWIWLHVYSFWCCMASSMTSSGLKIGQIFKFAITPSIFELERRTKSQNVGNGMTYLGVGLNFRYNFRFKSSPGPQNGGHFEIFEIF